MKVIRFSEIILDSSFLEENDFLRVKGVIARAGVQNYYSDAGVLIREFRPPEEVEKSAPSFASQPITLDHPDHVNRSNVSEVLRGYTGLTQYADGLLTADLCITHPDAIAAAKTTHRQLSCGYYADLEPASGTWIDTLGIQGEKGKSYEYDAVQTNICGNHIALVEQARAGDIATIHLPNEVATYEFFKFVQDCKQMEQTQTETETKVETAPETWGWQKFNADLINENKLLKDQLETIKGRLAATEVKLQDSLQTRKADSAKIAEEVNRRVECWLELSSQSDFKADSLNSALSVTEIQKNYLKTVAPELSEKIETASASYLDGLWDCLKPTKSTKKVDDVKNLLLKTESERKEPDLVEKASLAAVDRRTTAWKKKNN